MLASASELFSVIRSVKLLIQGCKDGSSLWGLIQVEFVSYQFYVLVKVKARALDILSLSLLNITIEIREQVELLHKQVKKVELYVDSREIQCREDLLQVMMANNNKQIKKNNAFVDCQKLQEILTDIGLREVSDYDEEISKLETESQNQAGTGGLIVVSNIHNLISLVSYSKSMIFRDGRDEERKEEEEFTTFSIGMNREFCSSSQSSAQNIPDEFCCPISLDLMGDPVIVSSGHSYVRNSIAQWINSGHHTCPKSGQRLIHAALIANYALKSLVHQWCQENNIPLTELKSTLSSKMEKSSSTRKPNHTAIDFISSNKAAIDVIKRTSEFLVGKLATGSQNIQRQAAYELRLLAKAGMDNRKIIAEAGAIPFLVTLLGSRDQRIQENAVTALFNLSIFDNNKVLIVAAGGVNNVVEVLESGRTMEAKENAAATIFSLSTRDDCKITIGRHPRAIPKLIGLLKEGTSIGKKDAATALFNLAVYDPNKARIVRAGAVSLLIDLLIDEKAGITDDALGVLALLQGCPEGQEQIKLSSALVPLLIDLLRFGSPKGKENFITLLLSNQKRRRISGTVSIGKSKKYSIASEPDNWWFTASSKKGRRLT